MFSLLAKNKFINGVGNNRAGNLISSTGCVHVVSTCANRDFEPHSSIDDGDFPTSYIIKMQWPYKPLAAVVYHSYNWIG